MSALQGLSLEIGLAPACAVMQIHRGAIYRDLARRRRLVEVCGPARPRPNPPLAFSNTERTNLLQCLYSERFMDCAPRSVYATLLDEGRYLGSVRTMYRLLQAKAQSGERRHQLTHPVYRKPELLAVQPNEIWSWDITKLRGPVKWSVYHLYVILDIFSRYVVGWMIALRESAQLAKQLIGETIHKHDIAPGTLTLHADRGSSMRSKLVAELLIDLDVTKSHSRPYVSDDNPFSESQFRTFKYRPEFPDRFGSIEDARAHCQRFFQWYNESHRHSGIGLMTPSTVHFGRDKALRLKRQRALDAAFHAHPNRFKGNAPKPPELPIAVWINPPKKESAPSELQDACTLNSSNLVSHSH
jgi:putative transposase